MTTLITKRGNGVPTAANLVEGEQAIDLQTGRVYTLSGGVVIECGRDTHDIDFHTDVDTTTTTPDDGDVLTYDGASNVWMPQAPSGGSSVDKPYIISPSDGAVDIDEPYVFQSTAFGSNVGSAHLSSDWVIYSDASLSTVAYQVTGVTGSERTRLTTASGLADGTTYYVQVRYSDNFGNVSDYSQPISFTTTAFDTVIYEHKVSLPPVIDGGNYTIRENGYRFGMGISFWGGGTSADPYVGIVGLTTGTFGAPSPNSGMPYIRASGNSNTFGMPSNFGNWNFTVNYVSSLANPNFPLLHRKYFDDTDPNFTPALGFKWTFHLWNNMTGAGPKTATWRRRTNSTGGTFNQTYNSAHNSAADNVVQTPTTVITSGFTPASAGVSKSWNFSFGDPQTGSTSPLASNSSQGWYYAVKKIELIIP